MRLTTIILPVMLAACSHVSPKTVLSLASLSPLTADPEDIRAAVELPMGVSVAPNGAVLTFSAERTDTGEGDAGVFLLQVLDTAQGQKLFQLAPDDRPEYIRLRDQFARWEDENADATSGQFSIAIAACAVGEGPADDATFSVFISMTEGGRFRPLITDAPIAEALAMKVASGGDHTCSQR
ncbi:hypothetical protein [Marivita hallyeonensis]|uniref:Lipoprotein n=1 Tax=Marivita hallyeonensis TaxID=996342 RepID=A0A1M5XY15_9RHOB|nr:hypothetical protein [Marivita hallyeonensis]SHI04579.1 hypothetical protein SAMN05443551_4194 [Marivita hallyeonensis]